MNSKYLNTTDLAHGDMYVGKDAKDIDCTIVHLKVTILKDIDLSHNKNRRVVEDE